MMMDRPSGENTGAYSKRPTSVAMRSSVPSTRTTRTTPPALYAIVCPSTVTS